MRSALVLVTALLASSCSGGGGGSQGISGDESHSHNISPAYNVRVNALDSGGEPVDISTVYWGWGTRDFPEGGGGTSCNALDADLTCMHLDLGFEAQGDIWVAAFSPLPSVENCHYNVSGDVRIEADPTVEQSLTLRLLEVNETCFPQ